jgi:glycosyltransferase involved in cell wall biosynthesis
MRVLLLCTDAFGGYGGIALFNRELVCALSEHPRVEEIVVLPRVIRNELEPLPPKTTFVEGAARGGAAYVPSLMKTLRSGKFDLVICGHVNLLPIARMASKDPLLITHGIEAWKPLRDRVSSRVLHTCRAIVSVSDVTRRRLLEWSHFAGPTFVLPNAIRADGYGIRPKNRELSARLQLDGKRVVLTVGRVSGSERYKGFDEVIDVLPDLVRDHPDLMYVIGGGGTDASRLAAKSVERGVAKHIVFTGIFPEAMKADLYNLADVYAMPSRGEGFGFVFLEAMASGVPVIASKHDGGCEALLEGKLGTLVDPANLAELRVSINDQLTRGERRIPEGLDYFAVERFAERVHAIIDSTTDPVDRSRQSR